MAATGGRYIAIGLSLHGKATQRQDGFIYALTELCKKYQEVGLDIIGVMLISHEMYQKIVDEADEETDKFGFNL